MDAPADPQGILRHVYRGHPAAEAGEVAARPGGAGAEIEDAHLRVEPQGVDLLIVFTFSLLLYVF